MGLPYSSRPEKLQLILNKPGETYSFRCEIGKEKDLLEALYDSAEELLELLCDSAKDKRTSFDRYDARVLSSRLSKALILMQQENKLLENFI